MSDKQLNERNQSWRSHQCSGKTLRREAVHLLVILGIILTVTVASCAKPPVTTLPVPVTLTPAVPSPTVSPCPTLTPGVSTPLYDKLDPFFRDGFEQVADYEQLILDLCFEHPPSEQVLRDVETQVIEVQWTGPVAHMIELPCWAVRVRLTPQSLPAISHTNGLYRLVLIDPAPTADYLSKLDNIVQTLVRYRENSAKLTVFVHAKEEMSQTRIRELKGLGLTLMPETWIPPNGSHPTGFYLGEIQACNVVQLAKLGDIVRIASAETELKPSPEETIPGG